MHERCECRYARICVYCIYRKLLTTYARATCVRINRNGFSKRPVNSCRARGISWDSGAVSIPHPKYYIIIIFIIPTYSNAEDDILLLSSFYIIITSLCELPRAVYMHHLVQSLSRNFTYIHDFQVTSIVHYLYYDDIYYANRYFVLVLFYNYKLSVKYIILYL